MIVCDSNVLISALCFPGGAPDRIFQHILSLRLKHATSPDILTEIEQVLHRKFRHLHDHIPDILRLIEEVSQLVYPNRRLNIVIDDPADNRILECAVAAKAQFLITGDKKHLLPLKSFQGIQIVSPREFLITLQSPGVFE
jgi:uncharacterized protein